MNTPTLITERLLLRKFTEKDLKALYEVYSDKEANTFLPWFPLETLESAKSFYENHYVSKYRLETAYNYAVCLRENDYPIGYVNVSTEDGYDFGYGLRKKFWHQGIMTEACKEVVCQLKKDGFPYITATHDIHNPRSGQVMKNLGMTYCYSYQEQWQPKNILVTFRMYQLNLNTHKMKVYKKYWDCSDIHFIETDL